jgi:hypothetical protein
LYYGLTHKYRNNTEQLKQLMEKSI